MSYSKPQEDSDKVRNPLQRAMIINLLQESVRVVVPGVLPEDNNITVLIQQYFIIKENITRLTVQLEWMLKEEKEHNDKIEELKREIETLKHEEDSLENQMNLSFIELEKKIQANSDKISKIDFQFSEENIKPEAKQELPSVFNLKELLHRFNALERQVTSNTAAIQSIISDHNEPENISAIKTEIDHLVQMNKTLHQDLASIHEHMNELTRRMDHLEKQGQTSETSKMSKLKHHLLPRSTTKDPQSESSLVDETNDTKSSNKSYLSDTIESGYQSLSFSNGQSLVMEHPSVSSTPESKGSCSRASDKH